jgi:hypothetical protein
MNREYQYKIMGQTPTPAKQSKTTEGAVVKYIKSSQQLDPKKHNSKSKSKSTNKNKSGKPQNKITLKDIHLPLILPEHHSNTRFKSPIANRVRLTASQDKNCDRERLFKRKNGLENAKRPRSKKGSKRSTDN